MACLLMAVMFDALVCGDSRCRVVLCLLVS